MSVFGENLKQLREEKGLSQLALSKALKTSSQNINRWERGDVLPSIDFCVKISNFFNCSIDFLAGVFDEDGRPFPTELPEKEKALIKAFRKLDKYEQETVLVQIGALAEKKL